MEEFGEIARRAAKAAGEILVDMRGKFAVRSKSQRDLVTEVDIAAQRRIEAIVRTAFPDHGFLGEESTPDERRGAQNASHVWVVDPLDGTTNYIHDFPFFCVSVALLRHGVPVAAAVFDPTRNTLFHATLGGGAYRDDSPIRVRIVEDVSEALLATSFAAEVTENSPEVRGFLKILPHARAVRRVGSTALNLALVASGQLDGYWSTTCHAWDIAAGMLLVSEAGGTVTDWRGQPSRILDDSRLLAAASRELHGQLRTILEVSDASREQGPVQ